MMAIAFMLSGSLSSQTLPITPSNYLSPTSNLNVKNTGNYIQIRSVGLSTGDMRVSVWDGDTPSFGWRDDISATSGDILLNPDLTDPDVAISSDGLSATVVYVLNNNIYAERYDFAGGVFALASGPNLVFTGGSCRTPNIDNSFYGVITWDSDVSGIRQVYTRDINSNTSVMGPISNLSAAAGYIAHDCHSPDVATYENLSGSFYHYSYIVTNGTGQRLIHHMEKAADISAGAPINLYSTIALSVGLNEGIHDPRIASQDEYNNVPAKEAATIAFTRKSWFPTASLLSICSYNVNSGVNYVTAPMAMAICYNFKPAITWTRCGEYLIAWTHNNTLSGCYYTNAPISYDILARRTDADGVPFGSYQWVNLNNAGIQNTISLSGRFADDKDIYTTFFDSNVNHVRAKRTHCYSSPYMREGIGMSSELTVFPLPAENELNIEGEGVRSISLYALDGSLMLSLDVDKDADMHTIDISELNSGMYILNVLTQNGYHKSKITVN